MLHGVQRVAAGTASDAGPAAVNPRLTRAAHEFEAQMMKELLKPISSADALPGASEDSGLELGSVSGSGGALADFASEALGRALSERGGFGIADRIVRELGHANQRPATAAEREKIAAR
jgi:Rod binding domain-containing protein